MAAPQHQTERLWLSRSLHFEKSNTKEKKKSSDSECVIDSLSFSFFGFFHLWNHSLLDRTSHHRNQPDTILPYLYKPNSFSDFLFLSFSLCWDGQHASACQRKPYWIVSHIPALNFEPNTPFLVDLELFLGIRYPILSWVCERKEKKGLKAMKNEEQARFLFGISLSDRPKWQQFLFCSSGFFFGYLVNGVCEVISLFFVITNIFVFLLGSWKSLWMKFSGFWSILFSLS